MRRSVACLCWSIRPLAHYHELHFKKSFRSKAIWPDDYENYGHFVPHKMAQSICLLNLFPFVSIFYANIWWTFLALCARIMWAKIRQIWAIILQELLAIDNVAHEFNFEDKPVGLAHEYLFMFILLLFLAFFYLKVCTHKLKVCTHDFLLSTGLHLDI